MNLSKKPSDKVHRPQISKAKVLNAVLETRQQLLNRLEQKGYGAWLSRHELLGFLTEEYLEAAEAVHSGTSSDIKSELMDIAVGCIFAIACINNETLDW